MTRARKHSRKMSAPSFHPRSVLVDANLMLVFVVGSYEPLYVSKHKNTRGYSSEDFYLLRELLAQIHARITTPHILTEVSNLLAQSEGPVKRSYFRAFAEVIGVFDEVHVAARQIALRDHFADFGLTDLGILDAADSTCLVITADSRLASYLGRENIHVVDFKQLVDRDRPSSRGR